MPLDIVVTNAGRAAIVNAQNNGTAPVTISHVGVSATAVTPLPTLTALAGEIKRVATISGEAVADDTIHLSMLDSTADAYTLRSIALYLADGTMFAIYGQAGPVLEKVSGSVAALSVDVIFADISAASLTFGDATFTNPPATTERQGVVELTTLAEAIAGSDALRALTVSAAKGAVLNWLLSQDGSGSGLDADLLDGQHASAFATAGHSHDRGALTGFGTMAAQNANGVNISGGAIAGTTLANIVGNISAAGGATFGDGSGTRSVVLATARAHLTIEANGTTDGAGSTIYYSWTAGGQGSLKFSNAAGEVARFDGAGNLGLGVTPITRFHAKAAGEIARFETTSPRGSGNGFIGIADPAGRKGYFGYGGLNDTLYFLNEMNAPVLFGTNGTSRLVLDEAGNLTPASNGTQILGWPTARWKEAHFLNFVRIGGNDAWHSGNDGSGSGLDADLLDGQHGAYYLPAASYTAADVLAKLVGVDGSGSGVDADLLDGFHASDFDRVVAQNLTDNGGYIIYASGRKECWGRLVIGQDSYGTWNLPTAHTGWVHPSFTYTGKVGNGNTGDNTMFDQVMGSPPTGLRFWNAEDTALTIYVRTIGV